MITTITSIAGVGLRLSPLLSKKVRRFIHVAPNKNVTERRSLKNQTDEC